MKHEPLIIERTYNAPVKRVWEAITDAEKIRQWFFPGVPAFEAKVGFEVTFNEKHHEGHLTHTWNITAAEPLKKISYNWTMKDIPGCSVLTIELFEQGDKTRLLLTHDKLETHRPDKNPEFALGNFKEGWAYFTGKLGEVLEQQNI